MQDGIWVFNTARRTIGGYRYEYDGKGQIQRLQKADYWPGPSRQLKFSGGLPNPYPCNKFSILTKFCSFNLPVSS